MNELKTLLEKVDDNYLVGLSNKGTVKRAYKDLEQEKPLLEWQDEKAVVKLQDETCTIVAPLGESSCTCPSRSVCRHLITAMLWLKGEFGKEPEEAEQEVEQKENETKDFEEFLSIPVENLKKACKATSFKKFLSHVKLEGLPEIEESSVITVKLPWEQATVKLLEPLAYSTCTCKSKELCPHKAQALLLYQLKKGKIKLEDLEISKETTPILDAAQVKEACQAIIESVEQQMDIGLSRQSLEVTESLERLAVISHRAGLPTMENRLREAASIYQQYFDRLTAFNEKVLTEKLLGIYAMAWQMQTADTEKMQELAGTFKSSYEMAGRLKLVGLGARTFSSDSGYEGEIYYFLEPEKQKYYTWTDARPTFYEGVRKVYAGAPAPWGLSCKKEQLTELVFQLSNAKVSGNRLSSSQETKGTVWDARNLYEEEVCQTIIWDFRELLPLCFESRKNRRECPVLVGAVRWGETSFDKVEQRFYWELFDIEGRKLSVSLKYSKKENLTIKFLERLEKRLRSKNYHSLVFFGTLYLDGGHLCLYPMEFFLQSHDGLYEKSMEQRKKIQNSEEKEEENAYKLSEPILDTMEQYLKEASQQLSDLFISGLSSVQTESAERILTCAKEGEQLGLHCAGRELKQIGELLNSKRHQIEFSSKPVLQSWRCLNRYIAACMEKVSQDRARWEMENIDTENKEA